jgi:GNAT superfamily N-acetyltransferase
VSDELIARCAANCASAYASLAQAMGRPVERWEDAWAGDLGLPTPQSPNNATPLRPIDAATLDDLLDRLRAFFTGPGGGYQIWSAWPTPDLSSRGFTTFSCPTMLLRAGAEPRTAPSELRVVLVSDRAALSHAEALWNESFEIGAEPGTMVDERALDAWRLWVGYVGDRPVSSAAAHESHGLVGIYAVATTPSARGRGYGEAVTWAAVGSNPRLSAALQASSMGRPVYARMGFEQVGTFRVWEMPER